MPHTEKHVAGQGGNREDLSFAEVIIAFLRHSELSDAWRVDAPTAAGGPWVVVRPAGCVLPEQGWKLHVTSSASLARETLERILPVLCAAPAAFKVVATRRHLIDQQEGRSGTSQIGKFVTVYPAGDAQAVRLATALDDATRGLHGPAVPSDRALSKGSLVSYRYGGFGALQMRNALGEVVPAIRSNTGALVPDRRFPSYVQPDWVPDPFLAAGVAVLPEPDALLGARYLVLGPIADSARSSVSLAFDLQAARRCAIKCVPAASESAVRLRRDWNALKHLTPDPRIPEPYDLFEAAGDLCLAMEDIAGLTIERYMADLRARSALPDAGTIIRWGHELAALLELIHRGGLIYRDLKSTNVLVTEAGALRLVDFELTSAGSADAALHDVLGRGTTGYMSPQQAAGDAPTVADDVYSLGALLFLIATGAEPSRAPDPARLLDRPVALLNPDLGPALEAIIGGCLAPEPARSPSASAVAQALHHAAGSDGAAGSRVPTAGQDAVTPQRLRDLAHKTGNALCDAAERDGAFGGWLTERRGDAALVSPDLNVGASGAIVALCALVRESDDPRHRALLRQAASWLAEHPLRTDPPLAGFFAGEAGVAFALLQAAQTLGDHTLLAAARARSRWVAASPFTTPDMFHGVAGRVHGHLQFWRATGDPAQLVFAVAAGDHLLRVAEPVEGGGFCWRIPDGFESLSQVPWLGYAHGAAGIGDALLELASATGATRYLAAAEGAARWLVSLQQPALADGSGLNWPPRRGAPAPMAFWCHGAAGVGRFLLHLGLVSPAMATLPLAVKAGRTAAHGARWAGPTQCHGLAGNIEFLLDLYAATDDVAFRDDAWALARLLVAFATEHGDAVIWFTDSPQFNPGYTVGWGGLVLCLLRLAALMQANVPAATAEPTRNRTHLLPALPGVAPLR